MLKYKDLTIDLQRMWNVKRKALSVITGQLEPSQIRSEITLGT